MLRDTMLCRDTSRQVTTDPMSIKNHLLAKQNRSSRQSRCVATSYLYVHYFKNMVQVHLSGKVCKSCVTVPASKRSREQPMIYLHDVLQPSKYRKIPKISHGAYIFQRPFLRGLFFQGLIYGGKFAFQNRLG